MYQELHIQTRLFVNRAACFLDPFVLAFVQGFPRLANGEGGTRRHKGQVPAAVVPRGESRLQG